MKKAEQEFIERTKRLLQVARPTVSVNVIWIVAAILGVTEELMSVAEDLAGMRNKE